MGDGAFPSLFAPMSPADARHWKRRPLFTGGGTWRSHLRFTMEDLKGGLAAFPLVKTQFPSGGRHREAPIEGDNAQDRCDAGTSICAASVG